MATGASAASTTNADSVSVRFLNSGVAMKRMVWVAMVILLPTAVLAESTFGGRSLQQGVQELLQQAIDQAGAAAKGVGRSTADA